MTDPAGLVDEVVGGDRGALARLLSVVETGGDDARVALTQLPVTVGSPTWTVGVTGAPGAGKSTLTAALVGHLRARGARVAVLAIDPTSPFSGGAILGDRVRMAAHGTDPDVYIRSMATRGQAGGLSRATPQAIRVLTAAGFGWIVVETVGVGQVEVAVAGTADTTVVVVNPGWGDAVQAAKAGLLETGDVFVVNKADRQGVDATVRDLEGVLGLAGGRPWRPPVLRTVATEDQGVEGLLAAIERHRDALTSTGALAARREARVAAEVRALVLDRCVKRVDDVCSGARFATVVRRVAESISDPYTAAALLMEGADPGVEDD
jgi:LAO/AO transport system kinase